LIIDRQEAIYIAELSLNFSVENKKKGK